MEVIALRLTEHITAEIDKLVKKGIYPNRSEALREAARMLIRVQRGAYTGRAKDISKDELLEEYAKEKGYKL